MNEKKRWKQRFFTITIGQTCSLVITADLFIGLRSYLQELCGWVPHLIGRSV